MGKYGLIIFCLFAFKSDHYPYIHGLQDSCDRRFQHLIRGTISVLRPQATRANEERKMLLAWRHWRSSSPKDQKALCCKSEPLSSVTFKVWLKYITHFINALYEGGRLRSVWTNLVSLSVPACISSDLWISSSHCAHAASFPLMGELLYSGS